ncbi:MAG: 1-deoxy-D-xylulose-5-phosphate reductoisomerase, partial [Pseudomonadota bacterium]|nr:1-deoxy-D-xylulose-5-phosphate reductoisomerase [Pseudomonadota bacterium]
MNGKRQLTVLGSTGSIGRSTLDVVSRCDNISIFALSAYRNSELLLSQCLQHEPKYAVLVDPEQHKYFKRLLALSGCKTEFLDTEDALELVAAHEQVDVVMAAIVGAAGLSSGLAAVSAGKCLLLANKESLIMSGKLFMDTAKRNNADIIPIDSEHNAIFQCLAETRSGLSSTDGRFVDKLVLTASGGPFLNTPKKALAKVTPEQACAHPKWSMGRKISVDSASLMNKGLELIEASILFDLPGTAIDIVVHPQSIVHSMVYYRDGSVLAQLSNPDMRVPIAYGLAFPGRMASGAKVLDLTRQPALEFSEPDVDRFPCISLGRAALQAGGTAPAVLNAANEIAVAAFLSNRIEFQQIPVIIEAVLSKTPCESAASLDIIR